MSKDYLKKFTYACAFILGGVFSSNAFASDSVADYASYTSNFFKPTPVHTPTVPYGWTQSIQGTAIEYVSNKLDDKKAPATIVRMTYTKATRGLDAKGYIEAYAKKNFCEKPKRIGHGFFTVNCKDLNTYGIVIGEIANLYLIEVSGEVEVKAKNLIDQYIKEITTGKHVFHDRDIGDVDIKTEDTSSAE